VQREEGLVVLLEIGFVLPLGGVQRLCERLSLSLSLLLLRRPDVPAGLQGQLAVFNFGLLALLLLLLFDRPVVRRLVLSAKVGREGEMERVWG